MGYREDDASRGWNRDDGNFESNRRQQSGYSRPGSQPGDFSSQDQRSRDWGHAEPHENHGRSKFTPTGNQQDWGSSSRDARGPYSDDWNAYGRGRAEGGQSSYGAGARLDDYDRPYQSRRGYDDAHGHERGGRDRFDHHERAPYGGNGATYGGSAYGGRMEGAGGQERGWSGSRGASYGGAYDAQGRGANHGSGAHRDPDYHQWREEQIRNLDNDYESWRQERYSKFADEFNTWRSSRQRDASADKDKSAGASNTQTGGSGANKQQK